MKKKLTHLIAICLSFLMMATVLPSILLGGHETKTVSASGGDGSDDVKVGVSLPSDQGEMGTLSGLMQTMFAGYTVDILIANNDAIDQANQIQSFIDRAVNVIVVMPVDEDVLVGVINEATEREIFVIVIGQNRGLYDSVVYVDFDYLAKAEAQVDDYVENHMDQSESKTFLIIACNDSHGRSYYNAIVNRILSYRDNGMNIDYGVIWIDMGGDENELARNLATQIKFWIENYNLGNPPDAIYCCCNECKAITIEALIRLGYTFGPDGIPVYVGSFNPSGDYEKLVALIRDLINKKMNNEEIEGDTFIVET